MKSPFEELVSEGRGELSPADKEKKLTELREWRAQVEAGVSMNTEKQGGSQDQDKLDEIDRQIAELEARE